MDRDGKLIFLEKTIRTVPYGFLGVIFGVYLAQLSFTPVAIGIVLTATVLSSAVYTLVISFIADRIGRRKTLVFFALTDFVAGTLLFVSKDWWAPVLAGIVGNMTVGAGEVGPFLSLETAILPRTASPNRRTLAFSIYNLVGYGASAAGALLAGLPNSIGYSPLFLGYMISGLLGAALYSNLSSSVEPDPGAAIRSPLSPRGLPIVARLSALFAVDAFGGGFIGQSILSYYFYLRFGLDLSTLGAIFFATQLVTALSFLLAERIARRIGLLRTMVFTHVPSNVLLIAVAFAPTALSAVSILLCRQSLSQMDVPTRQSYVMSIVDEQDRTAAAGLTSASRTVSSSVSPSLAGYALANLWIGTPLVAAGALKLVYDLLIYRSFRRVRPPEEREVKAS
ncbi:MAG TPA: MFS transporter [Thermoplasmata archaeon]|nr:MFS transporter [Thermoplasmata archaeon]